MMRIRIRVTDVDSDGLVGREHHPKPFHEGMQGELKRLDWEHIDTETFQVFEAVMENGDLLQLMGHEIELVSATHDGEM